MSRIAAHNQRHRQLIAVLDDDPTGSQAVCDVPLIAAWEPQDISWAMRQPGHALFVLTNTRGHDAEHAVAVNEQVSTRLLAAAAAEGRQLRFLSRGDSTLRGHFPAETDALAGVLARHGIQVDGVLLAPAFIEAGRVTVDDVHWVLEDGHRRPVASTEFARDPTFGYTTSHLPGWVQEATGGARRANEVISIPLAAVRSPDPSDVVSLLRTARQGACVVVNAERNTDLDRFVVALLEAEDGGRSFIYRTGPSFVRARIGMAVPEPLTHEELLPSRPAPPGLCIIGSHTGRTSEQAARARDRHQLALLHLDVQKVLDQRGRGPEIAKVIREVELLRTTRDVMLMTTREPVRGRDAAHSLEVARQVSDALVDVVRGLDLKSRPAGYMLVKGGLTSHDIVTRGLGMRRAIVAGQLFPGLVPVWHLGEESRAPGLPYVVFPGNVGLPSALADALDRLRKPSARSLDL